MAEKYYSQKKKSLSEILSDDFWNAWLYTMKEFANDNYLCESFGCEYGCHAERYDIKKIQEKIYCEIGNLKFEAFKTIILPQDNKLSLIEFFFNFISKPTTYSICLDHLNMTNYPVSFDRGRGTYEYTVAINKLFERFNHPYRLVRGEIKLTTSQILDTPILSLELDTNDEHLKKLINTAISNFYDRSGSKKQIALQNIVHSFERLKTLEDEDKKKSVSKVIDKISIIESVKNSLNKDMNELTDIANNFCIRHHEIGKKKSMTQKLLTFCFIYILTT